MSIRLFLGVVGLTLLLVSLLNLYYPEAFSVALTGSRVFPEPTIGIDAYFIQAMKFVVGLALILRPSQAALGWATLLFSAFTTIMCGQDF